MNSGIKPVSYGFGNFRLDATERILLRDGKIVPLTPKAFDILLFLVQSSGHIVEKSELLNKIWPDAFVEESNLTQNIFTLRKVLGDRDDGSGYIETVPRRGYRFAAAVHELDVAEFANKAMSDAPRAESVGSSRATAEAGSPKKSRWKPLRYAAYSAFLVVGGALAYFSSHHPPANTPALPIHSIAVLPLENMSQNASQDYVADGLTEELITDLARLGSVRVISRASAMQYRDTHKSIPQIGRELNVDAVIEGTFVRFNERIRVTAQIIDTRTGVHLWAETYERNAGDLLSLQTGLAQDIAEQIRAQLTPDERTSITNRRAINPVAHEAYLKGRFFWNKRTEAGYLEAIKYFKQAASLDPKYAEAYAGLADAYALLGSVSTTSIARSEAMENARVAASHALDLDSSLAEAHTSLAFVLMHYDWNLREAEKEYRAALQLNPGYATAHQWRALNLAASGRMQEALAEIATAQDLDPLSLVINTDHGELLTYAHRYGDAIQQFQNTLRLEPNFLLAHIMLTNTYIDAGKTAQALQEAQKAVELGGAAFWAEANLARVYAHSGDRERAQRILTVIDVAGPARNSAILASIATAMGDKDRAFRYLDAAYRERQGSLILINVLPDWDPLRSDPRFAALAKRIYHSEG